MTPHEKYLTHKDIIPIDVGTEPNIWQAAYCRICRRTEGELSDVTCEEGVRLLTPPTPPVVKNDWKEARKKRMLSISASQVETYNLCRRKWWLSRVRKLEEGTSKSQVFGTVVHAVIERFLLADDQGRGPDGKPVELYPEGWQVAANRFGGESEGKITPAEESDVKRLIQAAIENGVLERIPGRKVEQGFNRTVIKTTCPECGGVPERHYRGIQPTCDKCGGDGKGTTVQIVGFIDLATNNEVHDHKTTSNLRYAKSANPNSPNWLGLNSQMLIYAREVTQKCIERGEPIPPKVTLRHNVYCAKANEVRKTIVEVTQEDIQRNWNKIERTAAGMVELRDNAEEWTDISDPEDASAACNAYGGCPYRSICSSQETPENFEIRLERLKQMAYTNSVSPTPTQSGEHDMSAFTDAIARQKAAKAAIEGGGSTPPAVASFTPPTPQQAAPVVTPPPVVVMPPASAPAPAPVTTASLPEGFSLPPWASPTCPACKGIGFNTKGAPCKICDLHAVKAGKKQSSAYELEMDAGTCVWVEKGTDNCGMSYVTGQAPAPVVAVTKTESAQSQVNTAIVEKVLAEQAPATTPASVAPEATTTSAVIPAKRKRRTKAEMEAARASMTPEQIKADVAAEVAEVAEVGDEAPATGLVLAINCAYTTAGDNFEVLDVAEVFKHYSAALAKSQNVARYYELDPFKRRDALAQIGAAIADEIGDAFVLCNTSTPDVKAFVDALKPFAKMVLHGISN